MIDLCKSNSRERGFNRLEVMLSPIGERMERERKRYQDLYLEAGFHLAAKELKMKVNLSEFRLPTKARRLPEGISIEEIDERGNDEIRETFLRAIEEGGSHLLLDMTSSQQLTTFEYWFSRTKPFHRASLLLVKDDRVIGGSMARYAQEGPNIGPVWMAPEFRGIGLSNVLFHESIRRFQEDNIQMAYLEVDITNTPAMKLYAKYGFRPLYSQKYYSWQTNLNE